MLFFRPKPKQGNTSPSSKDSKQVKRSGESSVSPRRSDGLLHVTLTAKHNVQQHEKKMRVIEVSQQHCSFKDACDTVIVFVIPYGTLTGYLRVCCNLCVCDYHKHSFSRIGGTNVGLDSPQVKNFTWLVMSDSR